MDMVAACIKFTLAKDWRRENHAVVSSAASDGMDDQTSVERSALLPWLRSRLRGPDDQQRWKLNLPKVGKTG
jgi:hypothetical protein